MHRAIASLLVVVMLVPAMGPLAMAHVSPMTAPHCQRHTAQPAMHCHGGMTMAVRALPADASLTASDSCCVDHSCCRGLATLRWAKVTPSVSGQLFLSVQTNVPASTTKFIPYLRSDRDSARAPPRL